ncbi:unnamed protein product [Lathyrus sativus]|nr:unnamed protein product [Lathyrus sativus]
MFANDLLLLGSHGSSILHLLFFDDLLLFGEASKVQIRNVARCMKKNLVHISKFREVPQFSKYLGVSLSGKNLRKSIFHYVVDQIAAKLSCWKANSISMAGRVTLAKSVLEEIPIYPMMTNLLPKA